MPEYDFSEVSIPTTVFTRTGKSRPNILPHENFDHPFVRNIIMVLQSERQKKG
jgi:hypothetical protein